MQAEVVNAEEGDLPDTALLFARILREIPYYNALAKDGEAKRYTAATLARKLSEDPCSVLVAKDLTGKIVAFSFNHFDDYTIWVDWLGVDITARQSGIGATILRRTLQTATERRAHKVWCDTRATNEPSKNLLQKLGFTRLVEIKNHWYGQDFILWEKLV
jgi:ribosomal protein S18 acetylase RimI-like enzyme